MTYAPGTSLRVYFPSHPWHGKVVSVVEDVPDFNLAPKGFSPAVEDDDPFYCRTIFVRGPGVAEPIGLGPWHIEGTAEQRAVRVEQEGAGDRQGDLFAFPE